MPGGGLRRLLHGGGVGHEVVEGQHVREERHVRPVPHDDAEALAGKVGELVDVAVVGPGDDQGLLIERLAEKNVIKDFFAQLSGANVPGDIRARAERLGLDLDEPHLVVLATPASEHFERALSRLAPGSLVDRQEDVVVNGQTVSTFVVETDITFSGDLNGTGHLTSWISPVYKLAARNHSTLDAIYAGFHATSDITADLLDLRPA